MSSSPIRTGQIAVSNVRPAVEATRAMGLPEAGLRRLGLSDLDAIRAVPGSVTYAHFAWVASQLSGADRGRFVVDAARRHTLSSLGAVGMLCKTSATVAEALAHHARFQHLTNRTARYALELEGDAVHLVETRYGPVRPGSQLLSDYTLLVAVQLFREVGIAEVPVREARSRRDPIDPAERSVLEAFLGVPFQTGFEQARLTLDAAVLAQPVPTADAEIAAFLGARLESEGPERTSTGDRVREALQDAWMRGRDASAVAVGRQLGMSARTLQRRLREEGLTFAGLRTEVRSALAMRYLDDPALTLVEVAYLLGYRDETSFWRAFRRWTGTTPAAYRAQNQG